MSLVSGKEVHVMSNKKNVIILVVLVLLIGFTSYVISTKVLNRRDNNDNNTSGRTNTRAEVDNMFAISFFREVNRNRTENYLISPYSVEMALNLLREGTKNNSKKEIDEVIGNRNIKDIAVKNKIEIANALFIKNHYKDVIESKYVNKLKKDYKSEIIYDAFATPDKINDWVNNKTNKMIPRILDSISSEFVLGMANAIAIDVKWAKQFDCSLTKSHEFTTKDGDVIDVEMMHDIDSNGRYFKVDAAEGVILPYTRYDENTGEEEYEEDKGSQLELIAILPKGNLGSYVDGFTSNDLDKIDSFKFDRSKYTLNLYIPRFTYEYDLADFKEVLISMGIKEVFTTKADLTNIISEKNGGKSIYVSDTIHKTYIELAESGTKAAAVTYFGVSKSAAYNPDEKETITLEFNKPFMYIIRDVDSKEIVFMGTVYEPNKWKGNTCKE